MAAIVTSVIHPGEIYPARVAAIRPALNQGGATSSARVEFTGDKRIVEAGAPAEVQVTAASVPNAIVIPVAAIFQNPTNDSFYVFTANGGCARRVPVTIGLREAGDVQITSGLRPGQVVITSGGYALSDGLKVSVTLANR